MRFYEPSTIAELYQPRSMAALYYMMISASQFHRDKGDSKFIIAESCYTFLIYVKQLNYKLKMINFTSHTFNDEQTLIKEFISFRGDYVRN